MKYTTCDRCGSHIDNAVISIGNSVAKDSGVIRATVIFSAVSPMPKVIDLCDDCAEDLTKWIWEKVSE